MQNCQRIEPSGKRLNSSVCSANLFSSRSEGVGGRIFGPMKKYFHSKKFYYLEVSGISKSVGHILKGLRYQNSSFLDGFSITIQLKNCIFRIVALIARRSKYDFWIPGEILTLEMKIQIKKKFT